MQLGSEFKFIVKMRDRDVANPLWGGSPIYVFCNDQSFSMDVTLGMRTKTMPPSPDFVNNNVGSEWDNLKVNNSYVGINNPIMSLQATWVTDLGSYTSGGDPILTPYKLMIMAASGKTFYVEDERVIRQISIESGEQFYPSYGAPFCIDDFNIKTDYKSTNRVNMNINLREDKDL